MKLTIDFETRSIVTELGKTGPWPYAEHPSTRAWCMALKADNNPPVVWVPAWVRSVIDTTQHDIPLIGNDSVCHMLGSADLIEAHNVQFELAVWFHVLYRREGFPELPMHKLRDSAAVAAVHSLPRPLGQACEVMGVEQQKDNEGKALMLKMCKPRAPRKAEWEALDQKFGDDLLYKSMKAAYASASKEKLVAMCLYAVRNWHPRMEDMFLWHEDPEDIVRLCKYCMQDVEAEHALSSALGPLPDMELPVFQHDLVINTRGIRVDTDMARAALRMIAEHERRLLAELDTLTNGTVRSVKQIEAGRNWLASRGVQMDNMAADAVSGALKGEMPADARRFLEIRQSLGKSSTAKYEAALHQTCSDGRLRGFAMYHGASTGRWSGKGIQLQNLPRGVFDMEKEESEEAFWRAVDIVRGGDLDALMLEFGDPMPILSSVIRPLVTAAPGHELITADFSAIEGRGLAWLAEEEWVLEAYRAYDRKEGPDMYMVTAGKILGKPGHEVTKAERKNPGKIADLACGYYGGPGAIANFGGKCPREDRPKWIIEFIRRALKKADMTEASAVFDQFVGTNASVMSEQLLTTLKDGGWPYPSEDDIFELWARDVVTKWRDSRPKTKALWHGLEAAAINTVETGESTSYGRISYHMKGPFLVCVLPSGRPIHYPFPKLIQREIAHENGTFTKIQLSHMTVDSTTKQWVRRFAHGGVLTENVIQALCRDILANANLNLENAGFPVILHVHDESGSEVPTNTKTLDEFKRVMTIPPWWADGFPIAAAGWVGERYKKD